MAIPSEQFWIYRDCHFSTEADLQPACWPAQGPVGHQAPTSLLSGRLTCRATDRQTSNGSRPFGQRFYGQTGRDHGVHTIPLLLVQGHQRAAETHGDGSLNGVAAAQPGLGCDVGGLLGQSLVQRYLDHQDDPLTTTWRGYRCSICFVTSGRRTT